MTSRPLAAVACPTGDAVLREVLPAIAAALDGSGPALVPVPDGPGGDAVRRMARLDSPVEDDATDDDAEVSVEADDEPEADLETEPEPAQGR